MMRIQRAVQRDLDVSYRVWGHGPDVLLLHGWAASSRLWLGTMQALGAHFRCWAPDLPGCGDTPLSPRRHNVYPSLADYRQSVLAFCAALDIQPTAVIGHSLGALLALSLCIENPALFDRLILLSPPVTGRLRLRVDRLLNTPLGYRTFELVRFIWPLPAWMFIPTVFAPTPNAMRRKWHALRREAEDAEKADWAAVIGGLHAVLQTDYTDQLPAVAHPTLILVGAWDMTVPPADGARAAAAIPGARLVRLPRVAHQLTDEAPESVHQLILDFLLQPENECDG
jgi:pimeloyl-ACP methyl ester carboxylesterase